MIQQPTNEERAERIDEAMDLFKQACKIHTQHIIVRYLMSNADGRQDGAEKAHRHQELCSFYVAVVRGLDDLDLVRRKCETDYKAVHSSTQKLTDYLDEAIGFPLEGGPDYAKLAPLFFERFHGLALEALNRHGESNGNLNKSN